MNEALENYNENTLLEPSDPPVGAVESDAVPSEESEESPEAHSMEAAPDSPAGELDTLRAEVAELRELLARKEREQADALREIEDFHRLFPHVPVQQIPDSVWTSRGRGIPLNAAYALYEQETRAARQWAEQINQKNASLSAGRAGVNAASEYFSPDEVRAMTPKQVRQHYKTIRESMKKWN